MVCYVVEGVDQFFVLVFSGGFGAGYDFAVFVEYESVCYFWSYVFEFIYDCLQCGRIVFGHFLLQLGGLGYFE